MTIRVVARGDDFAEIKVDPKNADIVYVGEHRDLEIDRRRQDLHGVQGAPGGDDYHRSGSIPTTRTS